MSTNKVKEQRRPQGDSEKLNYEVEVRDGDGRLLCRRSGVSRSYVNAWNKVLRTLCYGFSTTGVIDTGNVSRTVTAEAVNMRMAGSGEDYKGIVVGTDNTPVTIDDYKLGAQVTLAGGWQHYPASYDTPAVVGNTCSFNVTRMIVNNTGGPVEIKEIGGYIEGKTWYFCGIRDVLGSPVTVPDGGSITVTYTMKITV